MKLTVKIFFLAVIATAVTAVFSSCEKHYFEDELYRKEVYIVSGENNLFSQEFTFGGDTGYISIYAGGTTAIDEDVTVEIAIDYEALGEYNSRNFDQTYDWYLEELPSEYYSMETNTVTIKAGSDLSYATLPIKVDIDELLVDKTYAIPLRIESVSAYMASKTKDFVLMQVHLKNDYATTKSDTYYSAYSTITKGIMSFNTFYPVQEAQSISASKLLTPTNKRSVRMLPSGKATTDGHQTRNWGITVTVDPIQTVKVYELDSYGRPTDVFKEVKRVSVKPYNLSYEALDVRDVPDRPSYYDPDEKYYVLNYIYKLAEEDDWYEISETLYDNRS